MWVVNGAPNPPYDSEDGLAAPLTRDGDPEPVHIEETDANFTIEWKGHYRYPTQKLEHAAHGARGN